MTRGNCLTDVAGLAVGHADAARLGSGVTAILFDRPATAAVCVLGGAPGGRDIGMLAPEMTVEAVDAIVLSGGSAFGLDAAGGVQAALREQGRGFLVGGVRVPIVPQAIFFDLLNGANKDWGRFSPYRDMGYAAAGAAAGTAAAGNPGATAAGFPLGSVGAGMGATTATLKGGLGSASSVTAAGHTVAALVVVNAIGSATIGDGPAFWAAPFEHDNEFGGVAWPTPVDVTPRLKGGAASGTTIGLVATDASLTKAQAHRLAIAAHSGLARALLPVHLPLDGDTMFAAATGLRPLGDPVPMLTELAIAAAAVVARAVARGVYAASRLPVANPQLSWGDRFR